MDAKLLEVLKRIETHLGTVARDVGWIRRQLEGRNGGKTPEIKKPNEHQQSAQTPPMSVRSGRYSPAEKLKVCLLIEAGASGSSAGEEVGVTSSTANTWYRQWTGQYRDGRPLPFNQTFAWVVEARRIHEAGES